MHALQSSDKIQKVLKRKDDVKPFIENYVLKVRENEYAEKQGFYVKEKLTSLQSKFEMENA